jgi:hypothetical protein
MFKNLVNKAKCAMGAHEGEWQAVAGGRCTQQQICDLCQKRSLRTEHLWGDWFYEADGHCKIERMCSRCNATEQGEQHSWGEWQYLHDGDCTQAQICQRCGAASDKNQVQHAWGDWTYRDELRAPARDCNRCGTRMTSLPKERMLAGMPPVRRPAQVQKGQDAAVKADGLRGNGVGGSASSGNASNGEVAAGAATYTSALLEEGAKTLNQTVNILVEKDLTVLQAYAQTFSDFPGKEMVVQTFLNPDLGLRLYALLALAAGEMTRGKLTRALEISLNALTISHFYLVESGGKEYAYAFGYAMINVAKVLEEQKRFKMLTGFLLEAQTALDGLIYPEREEHQSVLRLRMAEAYLEMSDLKSSKAMLDLIAHDRLQPPDQVALERARQTWQILYHQSVTDLPTSEQAQRAHDRDMLLGAIQMMDSLPFIGQYPEMMLLSAEIHGFVNRSDPLNSTEWALGVRDFMQRIKNLLEGFEFLNDEHRAMLRFRIFNLEFSDPVVSRDPLWLNEALPQLQARLAWARERSLAAEEHVNLWLLSVCYNRLKQYDQAVEMMQMLRQSLEAERKQIYDPMRRAGIFAQYPYLFVNLASALALLNRTPELLETIESAKGRAIADTMMLQTGTLEQAQTSGHQVRALSGRMKAERVHYLSFLVDEPEIFAVLVAKDGSLHQQTIPIGRKQLETWAREIDPNTWPKVKVSLRNRKGEVKLPERLAPLVNWLEPLFHQGLIEEGDHLCYSPDDLLHLYPLHYAHFRGKPLVCSLSVSRIHSADALDLLLQNPPHKPNRFLAVQVPAQEDVADNPMKVEAFGKVSAWLAAMMEGQVLKDSAAGWQRLAAQDWKGCIVHFATHGIFPLAYKLRAGQNANPTTGSGLVLAVDGQLPSLTELVHQGTGQENALLSPARVLGLDLRGSHVSMMACVSGLATEGQGGDALGLDWAFLMAGASSLLSSHWDVSWVPANQLSQGFYRCWLEEGRSRAEAWRETVLSMMAQDDSPENWAAFSLSGDWR